MEYARHVIRRTAKCEDTDVTSDYKSRRRERQETGGRRIFEVLNLLDMKKNTFLS